MWEWVKHAELPKVVAVLGLTSALLTAIVTFTATFVKAMLDERFERRKSKRAYLLAQLIPLHEYLSVRCGKADALGRSFALVLGADKTARDAECAALLNDWVATYGSHNYVFFIGLLPNSPSGEYGDFAMADQASRTLAASILSPWPVRDLKYEEQLARVLPSAAAEEAADFKATQDEKRRMLKAELRNLQVSGARTLKSVQDALF